MATKTAKRSFAIPSGVEVSEVIEAAETEFYPDPNVIGVGIGHRRVGGETETDSIALIVYVKEKLDPDDVDAAYAIPPTFMGIGTDVVAPFGPDAPLEMIGFEDSHQSSDDMSFIDWPRLHNQWQPNNGADSVELHGLVRDYGDIVVIQDNGTLVKTVSGRQVVDFVQAYKLLRLKHPDIYDFATFFTDTAGGMPPQGGSSWYRFVFNDTKGIGFSPTFDQRAGYGSRKLQGIMFLNQGHFPVWRYVMLQEQGHRWGVFAPYRDSATGPNKTDHMLGGWGHWTASMDDDESAMDYDTHDWVEGNSQFRKISMSSDERGYCNLDLYLMGLLGPDDVGDANLLKNITNVAGNVYTATKKRLSVENFAWANGPRLPSVATSQKLFKNVFVVITKDFDQVHDLVERIDRLRRQFEADFYDSTQCKGRIDTTLGQLRVELTPEQVRDLTDGGTTNLHRHTIGQGVQFTGTLAKGQSQRWFTHSWSPRYVVEWSIRPTSPDGKVTWTEDVARQPNGLLTYWLTVRNTGPAATNFEARYALLA